MGTQYGPARCPADDETRPAVAHYQQGAIEPIDFVRSHHMNFCEGNIIKYLVRWRHKDGVQDLVKARWYLNWLIEDALGLGECDSAEKK